MPPMDEGFEEPSRQRIRDPRSVILDGQHHSRVTVFLHITNTNPYFPIRVARRILKQVGKRAKEKAFAAAHARARGEIAVKRDLQGRGGNDPLFQGGPSREGWLELDLGRSGASVHGVGNVADNASELAARSPD